MDLSGRVTDLEDRMLLVEQQILSYPTSDDFDTISALNVARYNQINNSLSDALSKLGTLVVYVVNTKLALTSLQYLFTGHTGVVAQSGHRHGLTGEIP